MNQEPDKFIHESDTFTVNELLQIIQSIPNKPEFLKSFQDYIPQPPEQIDTQLYLLYKKSTLLTRHDIFKNTYELYEKNLQTSLQSTHKNSKKVSRRFKDRLTNHDKKQINDIYSLYDLDEIAFDDEIPYFVNFLYLLESINNIKYLLNEQFKVVGQYTYDNYKSKTRIQREEAERFDKDADIFEAGMHKGIIEFYKLNDLIGYLPIKSLGISPASELFKDFEFYNVLKNNHNFQKQFEKFNITKPALYKGFASNIYWKYAHKSYDSYKSCVDENNKTAKEYNPNTANYSSYRRPIPLIKKSDIARVIKEIFNALFGDYAIKCIRPMNCEPKILKYYDDIAIPTTKDITHLEEAFQDLFLPYIDQFYEALGIPISIDEQRSQEIFNQIRPLFY